MKKYTIESIGIVHSCFSEKFGIPRQPRLVPHAVGTIEMEKEYGREELFRELKTFSHIWVSFIFHRIRQEGWKPMVRPPMLGGIKKVGVFASRSPHRPNFIGISAVKLERIRIEQEKVFLDISGLDLLDGTPVVDIKPYLPYGDVVEGSHGGYTAEREESPSAVEFEEQPQLFCTQYEKQTGRDLKNLLEELLAQDPRPASQRKAEKEFGVLLWDVNCRFRFVGAEKIFVTECVQV